jgi:hypothetical protein
MSFNNIQNFELLLKILVKHSQNNNILFGENEKKVLRNTMKKYEYESNIKMSTRARVNQGSEQHQL